MLDEAARVKFYADQATAKGANNVPERVASSAKQFNETENLNTDIQDMYSRLDEMFPGFKKNTQNGDEFFELNPVTGKPIPGAKLQGGKNASMASRLVDTRKKMQNLAERAREATNPDALMQIKKQLDAIDTEFFGTNTNQAQRQAGTTINPESNIKAVSFINEDGDVINDFKSNIRTDDGVEFSGRSDVNQLGPKTTGNLENLLRRRQSGFKQSQTRLPPPVEGTLSTQDTLLNILRDIQQGKLGPIGQ